MAVLNTRVGSRKFLNGTVIEYGTWSDAAAASSGQITATAQSSGDPVMPIGYILASYFTSNGNHAVIQAATTDPKTIKITCTTSDAGTYALIGQVV
jgi:hypothetical protein